MLEVIVDGTPRSLQAKSQGKELWKTKVRTCAEQQISSDSRLDFTDVTVWIVHYCFNWKSTSGDLDNIAKPILDGISTVAFFDDNQIQQLHMRRTDLAKNKVTIVEGASALLAERLQRAYTDDADPGFVYIAVTDAIDHERLS